MNKSYKMNIAGLERELPLCKLNDELYIGAFIMFGDVEITTATAKELLARIPEFDVVVTAEAKGIPLAYEIARQTGKAKYIVARKYPKLYMRDIISVDVRSITTDKVQTLYLDGEEAEYMSGKRILIIDDVISTGESLRALEELIKATNGTIVCRAAVLAEGDAAERDDIVFLEKLPLFDKDGNPIA